MGDPKFRAYSVNEFLSWDERGELVLTPRFQRRDVWSPKAKSHLIDTILRGLPIPIIFIRQNVDPKKRKQIREVVDGQQRLRSVIEFTKDKMTVLKSQNPSYGGNKFSAMPIEIQKKFLSYEFSVVVLEEVSNADVLDIFARLNTYAQKLTAQELLNAQYFGEFKQTVYNLGYEHLEFWRQNGILQDRQIMRMGEAEMTTELLVVMLVGIQTRRNKIKSLYEDNDDSFPKKDKVVKEFKSVIDTITKCFGDTLRDTIFSKRILFQSLFCSFYHVMYGIPDTGELGKGGLHRHLSSSELQRIKDSLKKLNHRYTKGAKTKEIENFIDASQKATSERDQRTLRVNTISEYIREAITSKK